MAVQPSTCRLARARANTPARCIFARIVSARSGLRCSPPARAAKGRLRLPRRPASQVANATQQDRAEWVDELRRWMQAQGCFIDDRVEYVDDVSGCGGGLFVASPVKDGEALMVIPECVGMSIRDAERAVLPVLHRELPACLRGELAEGDGSDQILGGELSPYFEALLRQALDPSEMLLGLFLALERRKGEEGRWHAYVRTLPEGVSPAWAAPDGCAEALGRTALSSADRQRFLNDAAAARCLIHGQCKDLAAAWRKATSSELTTEEVIWGLAHVHSRAYGTAETLMLSPFADLVNHRSGASTWGLTIEPDPGKANAMSACLFADGDLGARDEVTISYHTATSDPYMSWMTFGFVPAEWQLEPEWPEPSALKDASDD